MEVGPEGGNNWTEEGDELGGVLEHSRAKQTTGEHKEVGKEDRDHGLAEGPDALPEGIKAEMPSSRLKVDVVGRRIAWGSLVRFGGASVGLGGMSGSVLSILATLPTTMEEFSIPSDSAPLIDGLQRDRGSLVGVPFGFVTGLTTGQLLGLAIAIGLGGSFVGTLTG